MESNNALARLSTAVGLMMIIFGFTATPTVVASTPVRFKQSRDLILTSVTVNGAGPFDFVFDTAAISTVIDLELAKQLGLSPIDTVSVLTVAGSKTVARYRLNSLALASKSVCDLPVLSAELREIHAINTKIRGILGQDFISGFDYILNYRDQCIEFEENGEFVNTLQGERIQVERDRGKVLISTRTSSAKKQASKLVMDSAASSVVVFTAASKNSDLEVEVDPSREIKTFTATGSKALSAGRLRKLQLGNETFADLPVRVVDGRAAIVGRRENGLVPTSLFRSIYFNNSQNFVIVNPRLSK